MQKLGEEEEEGKESKKREATVQPDVITVSSVATVPRRRAKFMTREQKGSNKKKGMKGVRSSVLLSRSSICSSWSAKETSLL